MDTEKQSKALAPKQQRFVEEYLVDLNATQAAIRAGYSAKHADVNGPRLLGYAGVQAAISAGRAKQAERTEINADWLLKRLADEAEADYADLLDEHGVLKPVKDWPLIWRKGLIAGVETDELRGDGVTLGKTRKVKLSDRLRRLELIGRHVRVGAFVEKHEHTGKDGAPLLPPNLSSDLEIARTLAFLLDKGRRARAAMPET